MTHQQVTYALQVRCAKPEAKPEAQPQARPQAKFEGQQYSLT